MEEEEDDEERRRRRRQTLHRFIIKLSSFSNSHRFIHHPYRFIIVLTAAAEAHAPSHRSSRIVANPRITADPIHHLPHPSSKPNSVHPSTFADLPILHLGVCVFAYGSQFALFTDVCVCLHMGHRAER
ncbi:hypothetical protein ACB092_06G258000 [Castanea dentata]